jgi:hypothetical protein
MTISRTNVARIVLTAACLLCCPLASAQTPPASQSPPLKPPAVQPAIDGILSAFKDRPLVGMSDAHGLAQQQDFYAALLRDPRFAREVGNVVVEFGTASHQAIIDRYVAGEDVPYTELRKVWSDAVGWNPTVTYIGFANVFATARAVNLTLPPAQRIRVWLGDPPIDWSTATERDARAALRNRDTHAADVIVANILSRNRKALVIYGGAHLISDKPANAKSRPKPSAGAEEALRKFLADAVKGAPDYTAMTPELAAQVQRGLAGAQADLARRGAITEVAFKESYDTGADYFIVTFANDGPSRFVLVRDAQGRISKFGPENPNLRDQVEERYPRSFFLVWPHRGNGQGACSEGFEGSLRDWPVPALATVRGSSLEAALREPACSVVTSQSPWLEGFLYLGPVATLVRSPALPDLYLDAAYRAEIARRQPLKGNQPVPLAVDMTSYPATPRPWQTPAAAPTR